MSDTNQWSVTVSGEPPPPPEIPWALIAGGALVAGVAVGVYVWRKK